MNIYLAIHLQVLNNLLSEVLSSGSTLQVTGSVLRTRSNGVQHSSLKLVGLGVQRQVSQHHDGRQQQGSWVGKTLTSDVWSRTVDGLKNRHLVTHVTGRSQTQTSNQTRGQVRHDVTVQVWHDHNHIGVVRWVRSQSQRGVVQQLVGQLNVWVLLTDLLGGLDEQTIGQLHDGGLVDNNNVRLVDALGVLEGVSDDLLRSRLGDQLDRLDHTWHNSVLNTRVLTLGVLSDQHGVNIVVRGLVTDNGLTWSDVGEQVEGSSQGQVHGGVTLTDWSSQRTLQGHQVSVDGVNGILWQGGLTVDQKWSDIHRLPLNWELGGSIDILDSLGDFDSDTITLNQGDGVVAVGVFQSGELAWDVGSGELGECSGLS